MWEDPLLKRLVESEPFGGYSLREDYNTEINTIEAELTKVLEFINKNNKKLNIKFPFIIGFFDDNNNIDGNNIFLMNGFSIRKDCFQYTSKNSGPVKNCLKNETPLMTFGPKAQYLNNGKDIYNNIKIFSSDAHNILLQAGYKRSQTAITSQQWKSIQLEVQRKAQNSTGSEIAASISNSFGQQVEPSWQKPIGQ